MAGAAEPVPQAHDTLLAVSVNGEPMPTARLLQLPDGRLLVRTEDLLRWRFVLPAQPPLQRDGDSYLPLEALVGVHWRLDAATQTLLIDTAPGKLQPTQLSLGGAQFSAPPPAPLGGFFNYDLSAQSVQSAQSAPSAAPQRWAGGLFEAVVFGGRGSLANSAVARSAPGPGLLRLDSTWTLDQPTELSTWRVGDAISRAGAWSQPVRLAGVQYATNFGTQPGFISFPMLSLQGVAALPSTVDLYVNDVLRLRSDVPAGPFGIAELPVMTGEGEARIVVRDLLGRQQTLVVPFYGNAQMLRPGLREFSYEVGALRANYGVASADYGPAVAVATERRGLSDTLTGELHAEIGRERQAAGLGVVWLWPAAGVLSGAVAASRRAAEQGGLLSIGFQRQTRSLAFGGSGAYTSPGFTAIGLPTDPSPPRQQVQAFGSLAASLSSTLGLSYVRQDYRDRPGVELAGASFGVALGPFGYLSFSLLKDLRGGQTLASLNFSRALGPSTNLNVGARAQGDSRDLQAQVQHNLPVGSGVGYRLLAVAGDQRRIEANLLLQDQHGRYALDAALAEGRSAVRVGASGGFAVLGGKVFASRAIQDSFALVELPGYAGVRVYVANQRVGSTAADGSLLVPHLLAFQANPIRIEQADLPLDATVEALGADVVPYARTGVSLRIPVHRSRGALITVVFDDGEPAPVGSIARLVGNDTEHPAAQRGEIYLTGLARDNRVQLHWRGQQCEFELPFAETSDPLPDLGRHVCHGVVR